MTDTSTPTIVEALKPFAALADRTPAMGGRGDSTRPRSPKDGDQYDWAYDITWGMVRAAKAALLRAEGEGREGLEAVAAAIYAALCAPHVGDFDNDLGPGRRAAYLTAAADALAIAQPHHPTSDAQALRGYRAATHWIGADSWDGCPDCMQVLRLAAEADANRNMSSDEIADALKAIRHEGAASRPTASVEAVALEDYRAAVDFAINVGTDRDAIIFLEAWRAGDAATLAEFPEWAALTALQHPGLGSGGPTASDELPAWKDTRRLLLSDWDGMKEQGFPESILRDWAPDAAEFIRRSSPLPIVPATTPSAPISTKDHEQGVHGSEERAGEDQ